MKIRFFGATQTVTGSCFLLEAGNCRVLIDCGLFQGEDLWTIKNFENFPFEAKNIDFLLLTHAHIDHSGRVPFLFKQGFRGKIYCTSPTKGLTELMLYDSLKILKGKRGAANIPFGKNDISKSLKLFTTIDYRKKKKLSEKISFLFRDAGHILGSCFIEIETKEKGKSSKIVFSGDLGNPPVPLLRPLEKIKEARFVIIESTYGDRKHKSRKERINLLEDAIEETILKKGVLIIPSFVLERTQEIVAELNNLVENKRFPRIPIFVDGELAAKATEIYKKHQNLFNKKALYLIKSGDDLFSFPGLKFCRTKQESIKINEAPPPKVIIVSSGMSEGGRILHHELRYLSEPQNTILFVGHQVKGTLGRMIADGRKEVEIFGNKVLIRASIKKISSYSAHGDKKLLLSWVSGIEKPIEKIFIVHGEKEASESLGQAIRDTLGIEYEIPEFGREFEL